MSTERSAIYEEVDAGGRAIATAGVAFHTRLAALSGLSASEQRSLDLIDRFGPLTAGELAERSGLAPASVTGLLSRLERKGFARRIPNPSDRRSVLIEMNYDHLATIGPHFLDLRRALHRLYETFTNDELRAVARFLTGAAAIQQENAAKIPRI